MIYRSTFLLVAQLEGELKAILILNQNVFRRLSENHSWGCCFASTMQPAPHFKINPAVASKVESCDVRSEVMAFRAHHCDTVSEKHFSWQFSNRYVIMHSPEGQRASQISQRLFVFFICTTRGKEKQTELNS